MKELNIAEISQRIHIMYPYTTKYTPMIFANLFWSNMNWI